MPPPGRRPFTTSSLTSTLRSTIASQPILGSTIDKLSSQANSFAPKSSLFGALKQDFQQFQHQPSQDTRNQQQGGQHRNEQHQNSFALGGGTGGQLQQQHSSSINNNNNNNNKTNSNTETMTTPTVDMSHLTEEERLMIQSVMAKAEMADMGMPVDTSMPSSTNLPSQTSQALTQQRNQQQQQRRQQQQMNQQQQHNQSTQQNQFNQHQQMSQPQQQQGFNQHSLNTNSQQQAHQPIQTQIQNPNQSQVNQFNAGVSNNNLHQATNMMQNDHPVNMNNARNTIAMPSTSQASQFDNATFNQQQNAVQHNPAQQQQPLTAPHGFAQQQQQLQQASPAFPINQQPQQARQIESMGNSFGHNAAQQQQPQLSNQISSVLDQFMPPDIMGQQQLQQQSGINQQMSGANSSRFNPHAVSQASMLQQSNQIQPQLANQQQFIGGLLQNDPNDTFMQAQEGFATGLNDSQLMFGVNNQQQQLLNQNAANINQQQPQTIVPQIQPTPFDTTFDAQQFRAQVHESRLNQYTQQPQQNYQASNVFRANADYDHAHSDHETHGLSSRHRREERIHKQPMSIEVSSSDRHQRHASPAALASGFHGHDIQAYDLAAQQQSLRASPQGTRANKSRRLPPQPGGLGPLPQPNLIEQSPQLSEHLQTIGYDYLVPQRGKDVATARHRDTRSARSTSSKGIKQRFSSGPSHSKSTAGEPLVKHRSRGDSISDSEPEDLEDEEPDEEDSFSTQEATTTTTLSHEKTRDRLQRQSSASTNKKVPGPSKLVEDGIQKTVVVGESESEKALKLLSELKLTEQANQVMEQQQLLIKQSQELIKLQQAQLEKQNATRKTSKERGSSAGTNESEEIAQRNASNEQETTGEKETEQPSKKPVNKLLNELQPSKNTASSHERIESSLVDDKPESDGETESQRQQPERYSAKRTSHQRQNSNDEEYVADSDHASKAKQLESSRNEIKRSTGPTLSGDGGTFPQNSKMQASGASTSVSNRHRRDLLQSPTDTTDSDIELSNHRRVHRLTHHHQTPFSVIANKPKSIVRRREPIGLPQSPLPVAAAIQLHQMQQQHFKNQSALGSAGTKATPMAPLTRANYMRSRSVTSSPNHLLERISNGYLTDNQRTRPTSPETMSEYGGRMRRRRRLPEPPTNAVPLTPSMVRKMIQAQKAAATSSGKLLTSVNAQSTLLTNMHSTRNPSFDRLPNGNYRAPLHNPTATDIVEANTSSDNRSTSAKHQTVSFSKALGAHSSPLYSRNDIRSASVASSYDPLNKSGLTFKTDTSNDLDKFLASTFSTRSVLANANISDVKETPELDKLISNLDDYYGLDGKKGVYQPLRGELGASVHDMSSSYLASSLSPRYSQRTSNFGHLNSANTLHQAPLESSYLSRPSYKFSDATTTPMVRRNSEGETTGSLLRLGRESYNPMIGLQMSSIPTKAYSTTSSPYQMPQTAIYSNKPTTAKQYFSSTAALTNHATSQDPLGSSNSSSRYVEDLLNPSHPRYNLDTSTTLPSQKLPAIRHQTASYSYNRPNVADQYRPSHSSIVDISGSALHGCDRKYGQPDLRQGQMSGQKQASVDPYGSSLAPRSYYNIDSHIHRRHQNQSYLNSGYFNRSLDMSPREGQRANYSNNQAPSSPYRGSTAFGTGQIDDRNRPNVYNADRHKGYYGHYPIDSQSNFAPLTKDDIINHGPKFNSIGYRFGTENQNKYVNEQRAAVECLQSRYPHPYKRILLSKNPKDRIGNGIGVQIVGGQSLPNLYDRINRCIISSGAFVSEVFQSSSAHFANELREGDQIIEWNGVNLCNRSDEEVQQILLSQFSDEEVEIVYLNRDNFYEAYGVDLNINQRINKSSHGDSRGNTRYASEPFKDSIRRKLSLASLSHRWAR